MQDFFANSQWWPGARSEISTLRMTSPSSASAPRNMRSWLHQVSFNADLMINHDANTSYDQHLNTYDSAFFNAFVWFIFCFFLRREQLSADSHPEPMWITAGHLTEAQCLSHGGALSKVSLLRVLYNSSFSIWHSTMLPWSTLYVLPWVRYFFLFVLVDT